MNQIIYLATTYFILISLGLASIYAVFKLIKNSFDEYKRSGAALKGWETRKGHREVKTLKLEIRRIPVTINGYSAGNIVFRNQIS